MVRQIFAFGLLFIGFNLAESTGDPCTFNTKCNCYSEPQDSSKLHVDCSYADLTEMPYNLPENTYTLDLNFNQIEVFDKTRIANLPYLKNIYLNHNNLHLVDTGNFEANFPGSLTHLELGQNFLTSEVLEILFTEYEVVKSTIAPTLSEGPVINDLVVIDLPTSAPNTAHIEQLWLNENTITDLSFLKNNPILQTIKKLDLENNLIVDIKSKFYMPYLNYLNLAKNQLITIEEKSFQTQNLFYLDLSGNQLLKYLGNIFDDDSNNNGQSLENLMIDKAGIKYFEGLPLKGSSRLENIQYRSDNLIQANLNLIFSDENLFSWTGSRFSLSLGGKNFQSLVTDFGNPLGPRNTTATRYLKEFNIEGASENLVFDLNEIVDGVNFPSLYAIRLFDLQNAANSYEIDYPNSLDPLTNLQFANFEAVINANQFLESHAQILGPIRHLVMKNCQIENLSITGNTKLAEKLPNLEVLDLSFNNLKNFDGTSNYLGEFSNLRWLGLSSNAGLTRVTLGNYQKMVSFHCNNCNLTDVPEFSKHMDVTEMTDNINLHYINSRPSDFYEVKWLKLRSEPTSNFICDVCSEKQSLYQLDLLNESTVEDIEPQVYRELDYVCGPASSEGIEGLKISEVIFQDCYTTTAEPLTEASTETSTEAQTDSPTEAPVTEKPDTPNPIPQGSTKISFTLALLIIMNL